MRSVATLAAALLLASCGADTQTQTQTQPPQQQSIPTDPVGRVMLPPVPEGHPDTEALAVRARGIRRMSVEQLERSLEVIAGTAPGSVKLPDSLAASLGKPDYLRTTEESLVPSPLFMKFMMDLGGVYCRNIATALGPTGTEAAIPELLVRFTGIEGPAAAPYSTRLRAVHQEGGIEAVCLALFTSPEFLLY